MAAWVASSANGFVRRPSAEILMTAFKMCLSSTEVLNPEPRAFTPDSLAALQDMFLSVLSERSSGNPWQELEADAFARMRTMIIGQAQFAPVAPRCSVKEDQIVWARSPVRFDLAGGWTDTPPYCLEHGGRVLNLAADLNGQAPIQVFARLSDRREIVLRSIDLGLEERVQSYEELDTFGRFDSSFAIAKAGMALAGFLPRFHARPRFESLVKQLEEFGSGIELSLLAAVPRGSGLGTSSILAATVLATLSELCGLHWPREILFTRTLALEQMLTTGGGWQDQAGALYRGVKLIETAPGLVQKPALRWLPGDLLSKDYANKTVLLYYTGLTRMAKNILTEIVRRIFLRSQPDLDVLADIGFNTELASEALQRCDYDMLLCAVRKSWELNQFLDPETNPPSVNRILEVVQDYLGAAKLLGAGGGGYLLLFAKDEGAALRVRQALMEHPPNARARFVNFTLSEVGTQVTKS
jgi:galactokinase/mevalonate kinase-like predicted kinase